MSKALPERISPLRLARLGRSLRGRVSLKSMGRLGTSLRSRAGEAEVELHFRRCEGEVPCIEGAVRACLLLTCQRCLRPMEFRAEAEVRLGMVTAVSEAQRLDPDYEPLVVDGGTVPLADIVEDELILAVPEVPMHPEAECAVDAKYRSAAGPQSDRGENPFAVLLVDKARQR